MAFTDTTLRYFQTVNTLVLYSQNLHILLSLIEVVYITVDVGVCMCVCVYVYVCMYVRTRAHSVCMLP
jgi:hypothetical protein